MSKRLTKEALPQRMDTASATAIWLVSTVTKSNVTDVFDAVDIAEFFDLNFDKSDDDSDVDMLY